MQMCKKGQPGSSGPAHTGIYKHFRVKVTRLITKLPQKLVAVGADGSAIGCYSFSGIESLCCRKKFIPKKFICCSKFIVLSFIKLC